MKEETKKLVEVRKTLLELFPHARPRVVEILIECLKLHSDKNNDYNGNMELYRATGVQGRFCDIWRKVIRLFNAIMQGTKMVVNENTIETTKDMIVYSALLTEELEKEQSNGKNSNS